MFWRLLKVSGLLQSLAEVMHGLGLVAAAVCSSLDSLVDQSH